MELMPHQLKAMKEIRNGCILKGATGAEIALDDVLYNQMDRAIAHGRRDVMRAFLEEREEKQPGRYTTEGMYYIMLGNERARMSVKEYMKNGRLISDVDSGL